MELQPLATTKFVVKLCSTNIFYESAIIIEIQKQKGKKKKTNRTHTISNPSNKSKQAPAPIVHLQTAARKTQQQPKRNSNLCNRNYLQKKRIPSGHHVNKNNPKRNYQMSPNLSLTATSLAEILIGINVSTLHLTYLQYV